MSEKIRVLALLLIAFAVACSDVTAPASDTEPSQENGLVEGPSFAKGQGGGKGGPGKDGEDQGGDTANSSDPSFVWLPVLETYEASVWAVPGESRVLHIHHVAEDQKGRAQEDHPFLKLHIPPGALVQREDGTPIAATDSVLITVSVDSVEMKTTMGPSGIQFSESDPPELRIWYTGVDGDLNGDGRVTKKDKFIENEMLSAWYQSRPSDPWVLTEAVHNAVDDWFELHLRHFSGFAVAY